MTLESAKALRQPPKRFPPMLAALMCCALFFACCAVYAAKDAPVQEEHSRASSFTQLVPDGAGSVAAITLEQGGTAYTVLEQDGALGIEGEETPLDQRAAAELLQTGASIIARQTLQGNPADYGIGGDALRAVYRYESGQTFVLLLGDAVPTGEGWYAAAEGGKDVYVVNHALAATLLGGRQALYALPELTQRYTANTLLSASIELPGQQLLTLERVTKENPFNTKVQMTSPIRYPANAERAAEVYLALEAIRITGVAAVGNDAANWKDDAVLAVLTLCDRSTTTLTIGQTGETCTLRIGGDPNVYTLDAASLAFLDAVSVPYLAEQLPGLVMLNQVSGITVRTQEETIAVSVNPAEDIYLIDGVSASREAFVPVYQQMIGLLIERYVPQPDAIGEARILIEYTFTNGQRWQIAFAQYDGQFDLVVRDGCACFLISREKTDAVLAALRSLK